MRNFNEIFRKDLIYDNIKSHKKPEFHTLSLEETFLEKPQWDGSNPLPPPASPPLPRPTPPPPPPFLGLKINHPNEFSLTYIMNSFCPAKDETK